MCLEENFLLMWYESVFHTVLFAAIIAHHVGTRKEKRTLSENRYKARGIQCITYVIFIIFHLLRACLMNRRRALVKVVES
jgi:hypothetical protein